MGKVGKILLAAVGVALVFVPGLGQALTGVIYGALAGGAVGGFAAAALTFGQIVSTGLALYGVSTAFSLVASLFAPSAPKPQAALHQIRTPIPSRVYLVGRRRVFGALVLFETNEDGWAIDVIAYIDGRALAVIAVYLNDEVVTITGGAVDALGDGAYKNDKLLAGYSLGAATETAFAAVISALPGIWTSSHRGDGVVCGYLIKKPVKSKDFLTIYPQGDNIDMSLVIDSWYLYDPREPDQDWDDDDTWTGANDNPVLGLLRYLVKDRGEDFATRIEPVIDYWTAAADICDSARSLKAGGSEKLYRCALTWDSSAKPSQVVSEFLKTFDGWMGEDGDGHILIYAGQLYEPTVTVDSSQIVDYEVKSFVEDEDRLNEVQITYISSLHDYGAVEAQSWRDDDDIAERGSVVGTTFEPQVPSHAQGQYLARRLAAKTNAPYSGTVTTNYSGRAIIGHRYINLTIEEAGATFFDGVAEILTIERNQQTGGCVFTWAAVSAALDDWIPALDEGDPAPVGDTPVIEPLDAPEITSATALLASDGTSAQIDVIADAPDRDDLTWYARWKLAADTIWNEAAYSDIDPGASIELLVGLVPTDANVDVEVAYETGDGRISPWSATETVDTTTAGLAPAPPSGFSVTGGSGQADAFWTNPTSPGLTDVQLYRHTSNVFGSATLVTTEAATPGALDSYSNTGLSAGVYYFWLTARNATPLSSSPIASGPVTVT